MSRPDYLETWKHVLRRYGDKGRLTVDDLEQSLRAEKYDVDRGYVLAFFKDMQKRKAGNFITGRRGHQTRMVWARSPRELEGELVLPHTDSALASAVAATPRLLEHELPIRPGLTGRLILPADLTSGEATRIAEFVKFLALE